MGYGFLYLYGKQLNVLLVSQTYTGPIYINPWLHACELGCKRRKNKFYTLNAKNLFLTVLSLAHLLISFSLDQTLSPLPSPPQTSRKNSEGRSLLSWMADPQGIPLANSRSSSASAYYVGCKPWDQSRDKKMIFVHEKLMSGDNDFSLPSLQLCYVIYTSWMYFNITSK